MDFEAYLKENLRKNVIDHSIRANINSNGEITFYVHADGHDSDTLDFQVNGNELIPIKSVL